MKQLFKELILLLSGPYYGITIAFIYILIKVTIRHVLKKIVNSKFDIVESISWFSVDISVVNIAVSISIRIHEKMQLGYTATVLWYAILIISTGICCMLYAFLIKSRSSIQKFSCTQFGNLSLSWLICFFFFTLIIDSVN